MKGWHVRFQNQPLLWNTYDYFSLHLDTLFCKFWHCCNYSSIVIIYCFSSQYAIFLYHICLAVCCTFIGLMNRGFWTKKVCILVLKEIAQQKSRSSWVFCAAVNPKALWQNAPFNGLCMLFHQCKCICTFCSPCEVGAFLWLLFLKRWGTMSRFQNRV